MHDGIFPTFKSAVESIQQIDDTERRLNLSPLNIDFNNMKNSCNSSGSGVMVHNQVIEVNDYADTARTQNSSLIKFAH